MKVDQSLDCMGLYCPMPIVRTAEKIKEMKKICGRKGKKKFMFSKSYLFTILFSILFISMSLVSLPMNSEKVAGVKLTDFKTYTDMNNFNDVQVKNKKTKIIILKNLQYRKV